MKGDDFHVSWRNNIVAFRAVQSYGQRCQRKYTYWKDLLMRVTFETWRYRIYKCIKIWKHLYLISFWYQRASCKIITLFGCALSFYISSHQLTAVLHYSFQKIMKLKTGADVCIFVVSSLGIHVRLDFWLVKIAIFIRNLLF